MHLKVPPPLVFVFFALLSWAAAAFLPVLSIAVPGRDVIAAVLAIVGLLPALQAAFAFRQRKTTIHPTHPEKATSLVTSGAYRFTRNPMYFGLLCLLLAIAVYFGTLSALVLVPGFIWYLTEFQIKPEEEALEQLFGAEYRTYKSEVRRWI